MTTITTTPTILTIKFAIYMSTVPTATILGGPDLHVDKGSTINLTCTVKFSPEPPAYIFWYHHEEVIKKTQIYFVIQFSFYYHFFFAFNTLF